MANKPPFRVLPSPKSKRQLLDLAAAVEPHDWATFLYRWRAIVDALHRDPAAFGEPRHRTKHPGGMVYHRLIDQVSLHYVVYDQQRMVLVLDIAVISASA